MTPAASAAKAGYASPSSMAQSLLSRPSIRDEIAHIQARITDTLQVSRMKVFEMLKEAYDMATLKEEAASMIRVASEINKMCGYYNQDSAEASPLSRIETTPSEDVFASAPKEKLEELAGFRSLDDEEDE